MKTQKNQKTRQAADRWADSMESAAAQMGVELPLIKAAKRAGCPGFVGSRVDKIAVGEWIESQPPPADGELEPKEILERRKLRAQYLKEEFRLAVEQKKFIPIEDVRRDIFRVMSAVRAEFNRFVGDLPTLAGLPAADIYTRCEKWKREVCENLSDTTSKLYT